MCNFSRFSLLFLILYLLFDSTFQHFQVVPLSSYTERVSLLKLRDSLGLRYQEWPIKSDPCANWVGVNCVNGSVVGINISGFKRTRIGRQNPQFNVDSMANFSFLGYFNASRFSLPGSIPEWFGIRLRGLKVLDLRGCSIVGVIPNSLGNLSSLTALYLSDNGLNGSVPESLSWLEGLSVLDLSRNMLVGSVPASFGSLRNLTLLDMSGNKLSGFIPRDIGYLTKLEVLNLSRNGLSFLVPPQLGDLSSLVDLDLSFNSFSGSLGTDLRGLRNLLRMVLGNNRLSGSLSGDLFAELTQLQIIVLSHNDFDGEFPDILWSIPGVRFLDASGNKFTGALPNSSLAATAGPAVFNLSDNMFHGELMDVLRRFSVIDLSNNYFKGKVPEYARTSATLNRNCFRGESGQRSVAACATFYSKRKLPFDYFGLPVNQPPPPKSDEKSLRNTIILLVVLWGLGFIVVVIILLVLLILCTRKRQITSQRVTDAGPLATDAIPGEYLQLTSLGKGFKYQQILRATKEFSDVNLIKKGHSGDLFLGVLEGGVRVVIKRISGPVKDAYLPELDFFSKVSHPRFVPLLGHCSKNESERFLIYKYMLNGDLSSSLYRTKSSDGNNLPSLDWITRLKIATGVAEALSYLHHECTPPLVHRDVQASSIFLDDKFEVRLGSLSEVCAQEKDIHQSRITRLLRLPQTYEQGPSGTPTTTCAYDVYCFGKVLLELVTGKMGLSTSSDGTMKNWLEETLPYISICDKELLTNIVDPSLIIDEDLLEEVLAIAIVARACLNPRPAKRPLVRYILKALENPLKVVREESPSSARLRTVSSKGSWSAGLFGRWLSSSDVTSNPAAIALNIAEGGISYKRSVTQSSQESVLNTAGDHLYIFPGPLEEEMVRLHED
ncbi:putative LRR receptor-like serine/threonine-protein kinase At2g16250 [Apium graveolens]|uniref:putative LRR receptor-like serine/threonine-protein kinase At2g16250 n=1 Tax=Apium graveolens TaxID=4045 RepID=UPI003D78BC81